MNNEMESNIFQEFPATNNLKGITLKDYSKLKLITYF
jgi:hypothetical protein